MRLRCFLAGFLFASVLFIGGWVVAAQSVAIDRVPPRIMMGEDVAFRVEGLRGNTPVGTIVVRVNGQWVAAEIAPLGLTAPLSSR